MPIIKRYEKDFFKLWNSDMAYILGFLYADGNITQTSRGGHYIAIYTSDKSLLVAMRQSMRSNHKIALRNKTSGRVYRLQVGSKEWFLDLVRLGLTPNKARRMELPRVPSHLFGDFVRGYFDGDGNVWVGVVHKERKKALKTIQVAFTSGSSEYLRSLHKALQRRGVIGGSLYIPKIGNYGRLSLSVSDSFKLYEIMYNTRHKLHLRRKRVVFERFAKMRA